MTTAIEVLLDRWTDAEQTGDADALDALLADDFVGIGPVGFVLDREAWVGRLRGALSYDALALDEVALHGHGSATVVVAHQHAHGQAGDVALPPETRVSFTIIGNDDPRIASIQYSFIGPPLGAPR
jgi:hypothetical protein